MKGEVFIFYIFNPESSYPRDMKGEAHLDSKNALITMSSGYIWPNEILIWHLLIPEPDVLFVKSKSINLITIRIRCLATHKHHQ